MQTKQSVQGLFLFKNKEWYHDSKKIANKVFNNLYRGNIILMHDIYSATANSLEIIIPKLKANGYRFVTVSELLYYES